MSPSTKHLVRHYVEMVIAMFAGMAVLGFPAAWAMGALTDDTPALMFLRMAMTMTVGMVGWMLYRGHGWRANTEIRPRCSCRPSPSSACCGPGCSPTSAC